MTARARHQGREPRDEVMGRMDDPAHAIEVYDHHNQAVRDSIAANRLLL